MSEALVAFYTWIGYYKTYQQTHMVSNNLLLITYKYCTRINQLKSTKCNKIDILMAFLYGIND